MTALPPPVLVAAVLLHAARLLPVAMLSPFLGGPLAPPVVRLGLALVLGGAAFSMSGGAPLPDLDGTALAVAGFRELAIGVALALAAAVPVEAARAAGRLVDTLRGATLTELHVAPLRQRETATGDLLAQWVVVLAGWAGGDRLVVRGLLGSFAALPAGAGFPADAAQGLALRAAGELVASAIALAAPAAVGILAADLAIALAARIAPQLGAVNAAQPARAALGLFAVAVAASAAAGRLVALVAIAGSAPAALAGGRLP